MSHRRRRGATDPAVLVGLILVAVGLYFLLRQLGIVTWSANALWPVLIIVIGGWIVWRSMQPGPSGERQLVVPRDGAEELELRLQVGAGSFHVAGGGAELVEATSATGDLTAETSREGRRARVRLRQTRPWFPFGDGRTSEWWVRIGTGVTAFLEIEGGAGQFDLDLSGVQSVGGRLAVGAAEARLVLPQPVGDIELKGSIGAADLKVVVPPGVEARIETNGLIAVDGPRETAGFAAAANRIRVRIDGAAAHVQVS